MRYTIKSKHRAAHTPYKPLELHSFEMSNMSTVDVKQPTVGVVGLGLIGGSFARAYAEAGWNVLAYDVNPDTLAVAQIDVVNAPLHTDEDIAACDLIILAAYPLACLSWLREHARALGSITAQRRSEGNMFGPVVIDAAGVKEQVCAEAFELSASHGFAFCGAHPMAGTEFSGYLYARANLFEDAPMVLVPPALPTTQNVVLIKHIKALLEPCKFGSFSVTTPQIHDRVIAFTSQLAHVVSNAYVKSPTAREHHGFSAGSYLDLTRVAHLNPVMWSELMMQDADNLSREVSTLIDNLAAVRDALDARDTEELRVLLAEGDRIKRTLDDARESLRK